MSHQRLDDGHSTKIMFSKKYTDVTRTTTEAITYVDGDPSPLLFYEREVTPPGFNGGGPNDVTNMWNKIVRTFSPKKLITVTGASALVAYDPKCTTEDIICLLNLNQEITFKFADGSTYVVWGWLNIFNPGPSREGSPPEATIEIEPSNHNDSLEEVLPVYAEAA